MRQAHFLPVIQRSVKRQDFFVIIAPVRSECAAVKLKVYDTVLFNAEMYLCLAVGRFCNIVGQVRRNRKCFLLLSGAADLRLTGQLLADAAGRGVLGELKLICGYALSRPEEEIRAYTAQELTGITKEGLYVLYIEHEAAGRTPVLPGLPDGGATGSLKVQVFFDKNGNGNQGDYEYGMSDLTIYLLSEDEEALTAAVTDGDGFALFENVILILVEG